MLELRAESQIPIDDEVQRGVTLATFSFGILRTSMTISAQ